MSHLHVSSQGKDGNWDINVNQAKGAAATTNVSPEQVAKDSLQTADKGLPGAISILADYPILDEPSPDVQPFKQLTEADVAKMTFSQKTPNQLFEDLFKGQLADLELSQKLTSQEAADLKFGFYHPTDSKVVDDKQLEAQLKAIMTSVKEKVEEKTNQEVDDTPPDPESFDTEVNSDYDLSFRAAVKEAVAQMNLPEDQAKALIAKTIFAHLYPNVVSRSPNDLASQLEKNIAAQMVEKYGLPPDYQFKPDVETFEKNLSIDYNGDFNAFLAENIVEHPEIEALLAANPELAKALKSLTPEQLAQLKFLHYHPGAKFPDSEVLEKLNAQLESVLLGNLINEHGFPPGWKPKIRSAAQDAVITGYYREAFFKKLGLFAKTQVPPLTEAQLQSLKDAFDKPDDPSVTAEMKETIDKISQEAVEEIRPKLGLPIGWVPPVGPVTGGSLDPESAKIALDGIDQVQEMISSLESLAMKLPDGPMRAKILDFLKAISRALSELKEQIFAMQGVDAAIAKELGKAELETNLNKMQRQREEMEKNKKSGKPGMEGLQKFMQAFGPCAAVIAIIVAVCTAGTMAALAIAVAVVAIVYTLVDAILQATTGKGLMGWLMEGITEAVKAATKGAPPGLTLALDIIIKVVVIVVCVALVIAANPMIGLTIGVQAAGQAVTEGKIIQNLVREMGGDAMAQEIVAMVLVTVVVTACAMGAMIYSFFQQVAAIPIKVAEKVGEVMKKIMETLKMTAEMIARIEKIIKALMSIHPMDIAMMMTQVTEMAMTVTQQSIIMKSHLDQAKLILQKARLLADIEVMKAFLKLLRKLINNLMSGMPIQGDMASELENIQKNIWSSMSRLSTNIASSGKA